MKRIFNIALLLFCFNFISNSHAQVMNSEVPVYDTILYYEKKIILYENNTWEFLQDKLLVERDIMTADTMSIFTEYWNNEQTFAYTYPTPAVIPDTIRLILQDSVRRFMLPYYNRINSGFGFRGRRMHNGLDIQLSKGTVIKSAFDGKVRYAKFNTGGYGKLIIIRHFNGLETYYSHLDKIYVQPNQIVKAEQVIGTGGNTGAAWTGDHLHFEMRYKDKPFDPLLAINFDSLNLFNDTLILTAESFKATKTHKGIERVRSSYNDNAKDSKNVTYHTIKKGETLGHIAMKHRTTVDKLCKLNNLKRTSILKLGKKIRVK